MAKKHKTIVIVHFLAQRHICGDKTQHTHYARRSRLSSPPCDARIARYEKRYVAGIDRAVRLTLGSREIRRFDLPQLDGDLLRSCHMHVFLQSRSANCFRSCPASLYCPQFGAKTVDLLNSKALK